MRLGVLDVGSNTVHLLVVDAHRGAHPWPAYSEKAVLRLAERIGPDGRLADAAADALVAAVVSARRAAAANGAREMLAFATSAVREATNSVDVLTRVRDEAGVDLQVLEGEDEARLTFLAVRRWFGWSAGQLLVLDIGGGSLEIAAGIDEVPEVALSLPLGAGRLTRAFLPDDPPGRKQLRALRRHVNATLREVADRLRWEGAPDRAVATSKTFKQLARLCGAPPQRKGPFVRRLLAAKDLDTWIPRLAQLKASQRANLQGVSQPRARQIVAGALVARAAMKALNVTAVEVSPWALREGIILHYLQTRLNESLDLPLRPLSQVTTSVAAGTRPWNEDRGYPRSVPAAP
jgi:exopolyphosphatase / guanosine-5'-triphosphate,3'-diphosphate pyrophosphatase